MHTFTLPKIYDALNLVMKYYPDNFSEKAKMEIEVLLDHCIEDIANDSEKLLTTLFIKAIKKYIGPTKIDEHIYLKKFEIPQIDLFKMIIEKFPFVKYSHEIINNSIYYLVKDKNRMVVIDIGIGQGIQMMNLLEKLKTNKFIDTITIIGIEPFKDALLKAKESINEKAKQLPFKVNFMPVHGFIENFSLDEIRALIPKDNNGVVINESLTLHHIQTLTKRQEVIHNIRQLQPVAFYLTEPNVDHFEPNFYNRFQNCYNHFSHVFKVIDSLDVSKDQQNAMKIFFGREIDDIIGGDNDSRFEKHEPAFRWAEKIQKEGFKLTNSFAMLGVTSPDIEIKYSSEGFLGFTYETETVLALLCAVCK